MTHLLLSPHADDETLFAAYTCIRERPQIVVVFQDPDPRLRAIRQQEAMCAAERMGCPWPKTWPSFIEGQKQSRSTERQLREHLESKAGAETVWAPAPLLGGHEEHTLVGQAAREVFGDRVRYYHTYRRGEGRTIGELVPYEPEWVAIKMEAMACYSSQIRIADRQGWFTHDWVEEFYVEEAAA